MRIHSQDAILPNTDFSLGIKCLFKARHPLEFLKPVKERKCREMDPVLNQNDILFNRFEDEDPPEREVILSNRQNKMNEWVEK